MFVIKNIDFLPVLADDLAKSATGGEATHARTRFQRSARLVPEHDGSALLFEGNRELLELLRELYPLDGRGRRTNRPLICLVRAPTNELLLPAVYARIRGGLAVDIERDRDVIDPPVPDHLPPPTQADVERTKDVLTELAGLLGRAPDRRQRIRRFRRFGLTCWLMGQDISAGAIDQVDRERELRSLLRKRDRYELPTIPNDLGVPAAVRALAIPIASLFYRARVSGRVPLLSGYYRWFIRRDSLAPEQTGSMPAVGTRLLKSEWENQPETTMLFLVNCFMEDIRAAYRNPSKHYFGVRRTTRCLLMISNISRRNGGYQLLRAVNEVRNRTGLTDPLLVVTESLRVPPFAEVPSEPPGVSSAADADTARLAWLNRIAEDQRGQKAAAWYLPLAVPDRPADPRALHRCRDALGATLPIVARREPVLRRLARLGSVAALLLVGASCYVWWSRAHCGDGVSWPGLAPTVSSVGGQCVGVSASADELFGPTDDRAGQVTGEVARLNGEVDLRHSQQPDRPVVTLIYLGAFGAPGPNAGELAAEIEGLKGVSVAQRRQLDVTGSAEPMAKVLFANGGRRMTSGAAVAALIGSVAERDRSVIGVVGLNESYLDTAATIRALAGNGIPTVAATLSADSFADQLPMYFQVAPQNRWEAAVAAAYAAHYSPPGAARAVRIYVSDDSADIYSANLNDDLRQAFGAAGFGVEQVSYTPDGARPPAGRGPGFRRLPNATAAGSDACGYPGLTFWAGRPAPDFGEFLAAADNCPVSPRILADDDATRYVANDLTRQMYRAVPYDYLAFAATSPDQVRQSQDPDFYGTYQRMFPALPGSSRSLDGHAALAYDAVNTYLTSVRMLRGSAVPISPATVWREIGAISGPELRGASGYIDFGGRTGRNVPVEKPVLILQVRGGEVLPDTASHCGKLRDQAAASWCPPEPPPRR